MSDIKFDQGITVATTAAMAVFDLVTLTICMDRHIRGDWGDIFEEDRAANERGVRGGEQIMSVYKIDAKELWIITEAADEEGKRVTTLLLPEDY